MQYIRFRELIGVTHTEEEIKAEAAECMVCMGMLNRQLDIRLISTNSCIMFFKFWHCCVLGGRWA